MFSIKSTFAKAAFGSSGSSTFWLLIWAIFILEDAQRREEARRKKREAAATPHRRPARRPAGPRP